MTSTCCPKHASVLVCFPCNANWNYFEICFFIPCTYHILHFIIFYSAKLRHFPNSVAEPGYFFGTVTLRPPQFARLCNILLRTKLFFAFTVYVRLLEVYIVLCIFIFKSFKSFNNSRSWSSFKIAALQYLYLKVDVFFFPRDEVSDSLLWPSSRQPDLHVCHALQGESSVPVLVICQKIGLLL